MAFSHGGLASQLLPSGNGSNKPFKCSPAVEGTSTTKSWECCGCGISKKLKLPISQWVKDKKYIEIQLTDLETNLWADREWQLVTFKVQLKCWRQRA